MITKEQYEEIACEIDRYIEEHDEKFPDCPFHHEFYEGLDKALSLIDGLVVEE